MLRKSFLIVIFSFLINFSFSQKKINYFDGLSRITVGFHKTNFSRPSYNLDNNVNSVELEQKVTNNFFLEYRLLQIENFSLNFGVFINSLNNNLKYDGYLYDPITDDYEIFDGSPYVTKEKISQTEFCLSINKLVKLNCNIFLNIGAGVSYEKNSTFKEYIVEAYFSNSSFTNEYLIFESIYNVRSDLVRLNFNPSIGVLTDIGLINLGLKYSLPTTTLLSDGEYWFYDLNNNKKFSGTFQQSGSYFSFTFSFTPSKNIFKKKK